MLGSLDRLPKPWPAATVGDAPQGAGRGGDRPVLALINEATKFVVSGAAAGTLAYYHNPAACWALTGARPGPSLHRPLALAAGRRSAGLGWRAACPEAQASHARVYH